MKYTKYKYKFKVEENFSIELPYKIPDFEHPYASSKDSILEIKKGYAWDGASGPIINTQDTLVASLVHDVLYQAMRLNLIKSNSENKKIADKIFFQILYFSIKSMLLFMLTVQYPSRGVHLPGRA